MWQTPVIHPNSSATAPACATQAPHGAPAWPIRRAWPSQNVTAARGGPSTILGGVQELYAAGELPLALLVFFASITVPCVKVLGLGAMVIATRLRSRRLLRDRTSLFRIIDFIGRWSMIDVFMVSILVAVVLAFLAFKLISGVIKFAVLAAIILGGLYFAGVLG